MKVNTFNYHEKVCMQLNGVKFINLLRNFSINMEIVFMTRE